MTQKSDLLKEVYRLQNMIAELKGEDRINIEEVANSYRFYKQLKSSKVYELEDKIRGLRNAHSKLIDTLQREQRTSAYFSTPEGAAHKMRIEKAINYKQDAWLQVLQKDTLHLNRKIKESLGKHWAVARYDKGYLQIGVIDDAKSTAQHSEFYFGQEIEIYYERGNHPSQQDRFTANCGTTGAFSMDGGHTVGERARFYVGIGKLFSDQALIDEIRCTMAFYIVTRERLANELSELQEELGDPLKKQEQRKCESDNSSKKPSPNTKHKPKHGQGIK